MFKWVAIEEWPEKSSNSYVEVLHSFAIIENIILRREVSLNLI